MEDTGSLVLFMMQMVVLVKLCVPVLVLVMVARAQVDICDNAPVLAATSTPQTLTSVGIETNVFNNVLCTVQITVSPGSALKLIVISIVDPFLDEVRVYYQDPFSGALPVVEVSINEILASGPTVYVFPQSVHISIAYDILPSTTFVMTYQEAPLEEDICTMMPLVVADNTVREIVTPNFGNGPYFDNLFCQVEIQSDVRDVRVEVTQYDIECPFDDVIICDDAECYNLCSTSQRIFRGLSVKVSFSSDFFFGFSGMRLEYTLDFDYTVWTPWMSTSCSGANCTFSMLTDTRTRTCNLGSCEDETNQERTRVCGSYCSACVLP